ncbi:hypothetical protein NDU88_012171 [Pleurodeles waltl]|uniref:Uncharacterized protein n=1 Tax=Pleurodeles waltl TaxID=8319 RepID=A0AAV7R538_PLEWA|nr:hypothetical protein NDU88_012171 [Pleurodeles waltl]
MVGTESMWWHTLWGLGVHSRGYNGSNGATSWCQAPLELRRSRSAAAHNPLQGNGESVSTIRKTMAVVTGEAGKAGDMAGDAAEADGGAVWRQELGEVARIPGIEKGE